MNQIKHLLFNPQAIEAGRAYMAAKRTNQSEFSMTLESLSKKFNNLNNEDKLKHLKTTKTD